MKINEKYILFKTLDDFAICETEHYLNNYIINERKIMKFYRREGFKTVTDVLEYAKKYLDIDENDIYNSIIEV